MGSIHTYDPDGGPALPDLPSIPIGALAVGLCDLLQQAANLPQPTSITIYSVSAGGEELSFQFGRDPASMKAIDRWARRFGTKATTSIHQGKNGPEQWVRTEFAWFGVRVSIFAHIPLSTGEQP
jgi:hypothetical protein